MRLKSKKDEDGHGLGWCGQGQAARCCWPPAKVLLHLHATALSFVCTALYCIELQLHCTKLHCTELHCTALYCTALHWASSSRNCTKLPHTPHSTQIHWNTLNLKTLLLACIALHCHVAIYRGGSWNVFFFQVVLLSHIALCHTHFFQVLGGKTRWYRYVTCRWR